MAYSRQQLVDWFWTFDDACDYYLEEIQMYEDMNGRLQDKNNALRAENDRLRELVRDMWFWHYEGHIDSEPQEKQMEHIDGVMRRLRELGVEL